MLKRLVSWKGLVAIAFVMGILSMIFVFGAGEESNAGGPTCPTICTTPGTCQSWSSINRPCDGGCGTCRPCGDHLFCDATP